MTKRKSYIIMAIVVVVGIVIDLVTKILFANALAGEDGIVVIPNFFEFVYVENTGAAYGMLGGNIVLLIIITLVFIVGFVVYDYFNHANNWWYVLGMSLILSGAVGNFLDRIFLGYVRDFISIRLFSFVFNIADLLITVGVICFVIYLIISIVRENREKKGNNK